MTKHEIIAAKNLRAAFNYEIGGYFNMFLDGETHFPTRQEAKEIVYECAMNYKYGSGCCILGAAPREMRFAGKQFCMNYIDKLFENDEDVEEIPWKVGE